MDTATRRGTPLRQRMIDDMRMRKMEPRTQEAYIRAVRKLAAYLKRPPDTVTVEELRNFQLHLVDAGTSPTTINVTLTGLRFFFDITLGRVELMARMHPVKVPQTLPVVLSPPEVARLIAAARNVKHQVAFSVAYGAGLRASEVTGLRVTDVNSQRMKLRVEQGKGRKDRYAMLSPVLLQRLRSGCAAAALVVAHRARPGPHAARRLAVPRLGPQQVFVHHYGQNSSRRVSCPDAMPDTGASRAGSPTSCSAWRIADWPSDACDCFGQTSGLPACLRVAVRGALRCKPLRPIEGSRA